MEAALSGPTGRTVIESAIFTIGSSPDNSLVLNDVKVSAHHAEIRQEGQSYTITDLGSTHGVYVNEQRLDWNTPHQLAPGNSITLGDTTLMFEENDAPQYAQAPNRSSDQAAENSASNSTLADIPPSHSAYGVVLPFPPGSQPPPGTNPAYPSPQSYMPPPQFQQQSYMPQYAQQPYIPPGYPGYYPGYPGSLPGYAPPAQPARRATRRMLWIIVSALLIVGIVGGAAYIFFTRSTPEKTSSAFCDSLLGQNYQGAYDQLSSSLQSIVAEPQFAGDIKAQGRITACALQTTSVTGNSATANMTEMSSGQTFTGSIALDQENNTWKIRNLLTTPSLTLTRFCNALRGGDFQTAYNQLSSTYQQAHTEAEFAQSFLGVTCTFNSVNTSGLTATANVSFTDATGTTTSVPVALSQDLNPKSDGDWKINGR